MKHGLEELAARHFFKHPNDKSYSALAQMRGTYGKAATEAALENLANVVRMADPDHPNLRNNRYKLGL